MTGPALRAIFFDLDNTLLDHAAALDAALREVLAAHPEIFGSCGYEVAHAEWMAINDALWLDYIAGRMTSAELRLLRIRKLIAWGCSRSEGHSPEMFDAEMLRDLYMERYMAGGILYEGVIPLLDALRGRYTLGIVSNGFTEAKQAHLRRTGLDRYFDLMILSEDLGIHKPDPGIFQAALDAAGVTAREALFIGDSFYFDIHGAWQAGIPAIWYNPHGNEPPADLPEVRPVAVARSIDELARLLGVSLDSSPL